MFDFLLRVLGYIIVLLLVLLIIYVVYERSMSHPLRISISKATSLISAGVINKVVDVRTDAEWNNGHYPGAIHLPMSRIKDAGMFLNRSDTVLVYCNTGTRARQSALKLSEMGFPRIYYIAETYHEL
jgi:rhodanese-related sulfurtransferase